jgi:hypothetical protein
MVDTDIELLLDIWAGTVFYRALVSREPITPDLADRLTALILHASRRVVLPAPHTDPDRPHHSLFT